MNNPTGVNTLLSPHAPTYVRLHQWPPDTATTELNIVRNIEGPYFNNDEDRNRLKTRLLQGYTGADNGINEKSLKRLFDTMDTEDGLDWSLIGSWDGVERVSFSFFAQAHGNQEVEAAIEVARTQADSTYFWAVQLIQVPSEVIIDATDDGKEGMIRQYISPGADFYGGVFLYFLTFVDKKKALENAISLLKNDPQKADRDEPKPRIVYLIRGG